MAQRGHWTKGKPRNPPIARARLERVARFFAQHRTASEAHERSIRSCAAAVGVSDRTLRRWLAGARNPTPAQWRDLFAHLERLRL